MRKNSVKNTRINGEVQRVLPLFINPGDRIRIDTRTGEYLERCKG